MDEYNRRRSSFRSIHSKRHKPPHGSGVGPLKNMTIEIIVKNEEGNVIGKREAYDWEGAEENFGKLQRQYEEFVKTDARMEIRRCSDCEAPMDKDEKEHTAHCTKCDTALLGDEDSLCGECTGEGKPEEVEM